MKLKSAEECKDTYKRECKHIHIHSQEVTEAPKLNAPRCVHGLVSRSALLSQSQNSPG